eukprot:143766_1
MGGTSTGHLVRNELDVDGVPRPEDASRPDGAGHESTLALLQWGAVGLRNKLLRHQLRFDVPAQIRFLHRGVGVQGQTEGAVQLVLVAQDRIRGHEAQALHALLNARVLHDLGPEHVHLKHGVILPRAPGVVVHKGGGMDDRVNATTSPRHGLLAQKVPRYEDHGALFDLLLEEGRRSHVKDSNATLTPGEEGLHNVGAQGAMPPYDEVGAACFGCAQLGRLVPDAPQHTVVPLWGSQTPQKEHQPDDQIHKENCTRNDEDLAGDFGRRHACMWDGSEREQCLTWCLGFKCCEESKKVQKCSF